MAKAKALTPKRAPGSPGAEPALVKKVVRKKNKRFGGRKRRNVSQKPENDPRLVVVRPPKAPEDFSPNWKALQELLKQKSQALEKHVVLSQMDSKKQPNVTQQNGKVTPGRAQREEVRTGKADRKAPRGPAPSVSLVDRKGPAPPTKAIRAEHSGPGTKERMHGDVAPRRGALKHKKRKAEEAATALAPALPTEEDIWFDDVDPEDIEVTLGPEAANIARKRLGQSKSSVTLVKEQAFGGLTKALAMDCEMVGVGPKGEESVAARVSIVNQYGKCVYDKFVKPSQPVTDYRTAVSGVRPELLKKGEDFEVVQKEVANILKGRILVGHALHNDLKVLFLDHPKKKIRDTQKYKPFKSQVKSGRPSLKLLAEQILGIRVQQAEHCSIQDAQAAMRLYITAKKQWESVAQGRRTRLQPAAVSELTAPASNNGSVSVHRQL